MFLSNCIFKFGYFRFNPEERDPEGRWVMIKKPAKVQTNEGEEVTVTIVVAKGDPLHLPRLQFIKEIV